MKKIAILLTALLLASGINLMAQKAPKPMGKFAYKCYTKRLESPKKEERRMKKGVRITRNKNISSNQVFKAAKIFVDDNMRLLYVKGVYPQITDKSNAIIICDAFDRFSHAQLLWEYIKEQNQNYGAPKPDLATYAEYLELKDRKKDKQRDELINKTEESENKDNKDNSTNLLVIDDNKTDEVKTTEQPETKDKELVNENTTTTANTTENGSAIVFPDATVYTGPKSCDTYLTDRQFTAFVNSLAQFETDEDKAKICMEYVYTYCFTTAQVMKLSVLMSAEQYRYVFFKTAYEKVYDPENFLHVKQLLNNPKLIQGINEMYIVPRGEKPSATGDDERITKCAVSSNDFEKIKSEIRKESFSTTRLDVAKRLIKQYQCLSASQIAGLLPLFSLETDKIDIAKYSYQYCLDRKNYSVVKDFFTSQNSKTQITEFINEFEKQN